MEYPEGAIYFTKIVPSFRSFEKRGKSHSFLQFPFHFIVFPSIFIENKKIINGLSYQILRNFSPEILGTIRSRFEISRIFSPVDRISKIQSWCFWISRKRFQKISVPCVLVSKYPVYLFELIARQKTPTNSRLQWLILKGQIPLVIPCQPGLLFSTM